MAKQQEVIKQPWASKLTFLEPFFFWLRFFYPHAKGIHFIYLLYFFLPQKILRINGRAGWPMHFTSRVQHPNRVKVGNRSAPGMNAGCYIQAKNGIIIGHNLRMGPNVGLISANHNPDNYDEWIKEKPIEIGDNVWIGMNTVILPGVKIGSNVVIGANSVVTKDLPDNCFAFGAPCKVIKPKPPYTGKDYSKL